MVSRDNRFYESDVHDGKPFSLSPFWSFAEPRDTQQNWSRDLSWGQRLKSGHLGQQIIAKSFVVGLRSSRLVGGPSVRARLGGPNESDAKRQHITGREDGRRTIKMGPGITGPRNCLNVSDCRYAAFAFFAATARGCTGCAFPVAFRVACVFSLAANSALTLVVIAATSTL